MRNVVVFFLIFLALIPCRLLASQSPDVVVIEEAKTVDEAVAQISSILEKQGFEIVLTVNHAAAAASVGLELSPTQVMFARLPRIAEKALLKKGQTVGIDLPVKFLVFEEAGDIYLAINSTGYLIDRHELRLRDYLLGLLDNALEQFGETDQGLVTLQSVRSKQDTVQALQDAIAANPAFRIPLVIDYGEKAGYQRNYYKRRLTSPVLIVFGNPNAGTPLMQANQRVGIDLPQKFLVWEDKKGHVNITYNDPVFVARRHGIEGQAARLEAIANALRGFALVGAGK